MALAKLSLRFTELVYVVFGAYLLWLPAEQIKMVVSSHTGDTTGKMILIIVPAVIIGNEWNIWRTSRRPERGWGALNLYAVLELILIGLLLAEQWS